MTDTKDTALQKPIYQYQMGDGSWIDQTRQSFLNNQEHAAAKTRIVYAAPVSTQQAAQTICMSQDVRALLLNVLWHHQGGSSPVGQPIRSLLGMHQFSRMTDDDVSEAKRVEALLNAPTQELGTLPYPTEITEALFDVLSLMLWHTGPIAHVLRIGGAEIKKRAEDEQAHVLHWFIQLAIQHGPAWRERATASINEIRAAVAKEQA